MSIQITWIESSVGISYLNHGDVAYGTLSNVRTISIQHDSSNALTNCAFYISERETYSGDATAQTDLAEVLSWGDATSSDDFGGLQINMNALDNFPSADWPSVNNKLNTFRSIRGDEDHPIQLNKTMNSTPKMISNGVIPPSCTVWPTFRCRIQVPVTAGTTGVRQFEQKLRFTWTS